MSLAINAASVAPTTVFVGLGSNLEDPVLQLRRALHELAAIAATELVGVSSFYETMPVGVLDQPMFINAVAMVRTAQSPHDFLRQLLAIEARHARVRKEKNGPRTLDLDVLIFGELRIDDNELITPHPRMHERAFVLAPLLEIAPELTIPGKGAAREWLEKIGSAGVSVYETRASERSKQDKTSSGDRR